MGRGFLGTDLGVLGKDFCALGVDLVGAPGVDLIVLYLGSEDLIALGGWI